jgi:hypothetical protein
MVLSVPVSVEEVLGREALVLATLPIHEMAAAPVAAPVVPA